MKKYRFALWLNFGVVLLIFASIIRAKAFHSSISALFLPPYTPFAPDAQLWTHTFQILCAFPPISCAFTWGILRVLQSDAKMTRFILSSALLTGGFLINEVFRVHILLLLLGIPKLATCTLYAAIFGYYGWWFRSTIRSTPYFPLVLGMSLLFSVFWLTRSIGEAAKFRSCSKAFPNS